MPNLKNYPQGFNPNYILGITPPEKIKKTIKVISQEDFEQYDMFTLPKLENWQKYHIINIYSDQDCSYKYVTIQVIEEVERENIDYENQLRIFNEKLEEWKILKARWDKEVAEEQESKEYKDYLKLKKKFEKRECVTLKKSLP